MISAFTRVLDGDWAYGWLFVSFGWLQDRANSCDLCPMYEISETISIVSIDAQPV